MTILDFNNVVVDGDQIVVHGKRGVALTHLVTAAIRMSHDQARGLARFVTDTLDDTHEARNLIRAKAFVVAGELGFTDADRHELAVAVVGAERSPSWAQLSLTELQRLVEHLEGYVFVSTILRDRVTP